MNDTSLYPMYELRITARVNDAAGITPEGQQHLVECLRQAVQQQLTQAFLPKERLSQYEDEITLSKILGRDTELLISSSMTTTRPYASERTEQTLR